jgi:hypothetical protein
MGTRSCTREKTRHVERLEDALTGAPSDPTCSQAEVAESEGSAEAMIERFIGILDAESTITHLLCIRPRRGLKPLISTGPSLAAATALLGHAACRRTSVPGRRMQVPWDATAVLRDDRSSGVVTMIEQVLLDLRRRPDIEFLFYCHVEGENKIRHDRHSTEPLGKDLLRISDHLATRIRTWDEIL